MNGFAPSALGGGNGKGMLGNGMGGKPKPDGISVSFIGKLPTV